MGTAPALPQVRFALILEPIAFAVDGDDRVLAYRRERGSRGGRPS
jgi:hypothetical protein